MKVQNIQFTNPKINFKNNNKPQPPSPIKEGVKTAGVWLGFGLGFDYVCRKCVVFKNSPVKNSIFVNSILALLAGGYTAVRNYLKTKFRC